MSSAVDRHLESLHASTAMLVAVETGLVDALAHGPRRAEDLAAELRWRTEDLGRLADACVAFGVLALHPQGYGLSEVGHELRADHPEGRRSGLLAAMRLYLPAMIGLEAGDSAGRTSFEAGFGGSLYDVLAARPTLADAMLGDLARALDLVASAAVVTEAVEATAGTVVDVGGGNGELGRRLAERWPGREVVVVDRPWALQRAAKALPSNLRLVEGDMFAAVPPGGLLLLVRVLFNWPDDRALRLLEVARGSVEEGARALVIEPERPAPGAVTGGTPDLLALAVGGRARTDDELRALAEASGWHVARTEAAGPLTGWELVPR